MLHYDNLSATEKRSAPANGGPTLVAAVSVALAVGQRPTTVSIFRLAPEPSGGDPPARPRQGHGGKPTAQSEAIGRVGEAWAQPNARLARGQQGAEHFEQVVTRPSGVRGCPRIPKERT
jgi:hypothetical protein